MLRPFIFFCFGVNKLFQSLYLFGRHFAHELIVKRVLHPLISLLRPPVVERDDTALKLHLAAVCNRAVHFLLFLLPSLQAVHTAEVSVEVQPVLVKPEEVSKFLAEPLNQGNDYRRIDGLLGIGLVGVGALVLPRYQHRRNAVDTGNDNSIGKGLIERLEVGNRQVGSHERQLHVADAVGVLSFSEAVHLVCLFEDLLLLCRCQCTASHVVGHLAHKPSETASLNVDDVTRLVHGDKVADCLQHSSEAALGTQRVAVVEPERVVHIVEHALRSDRTVNELAVVVVIALHHVLDIAHTVDVAHLSLVLDGYIRLFQRHIAVTPLVERLGAGKRVAHGCLDE